MIIAAIFLTRQVDNIMVNSLLNVASSAASVVLVAKCPLTAKFTLASYLKK